MKNVIKVRPVLQMEKTECGAASLAMILEYYGKSVTLENMRRDCGVSRNGVNAKNIVKAARFHKLSARAVKSDIDGLKSLKMPLILHWNMNHFLVLCGFNRKGAVVADPAYGIRTVTADEFSSSFTGIAIELTPDKDFETSTVSKKRGGYIAECVKPFLPRAVFFCRCRAVRRHGGRGGAVFKFRFHRQNPYRQKHAKPQNAARRAHMLRAYNSRVRRAFRGRVLPYKSKTEYSDKLGVYPSSFAASDRFLFTARRGRPHEQI